MEPGSEVDLVTELLVETSSYVLPVDAPMDEVLALFEILQPPQIFVTSRAGGVLLGRLTRSSLLEHAG